MRNPAIISLLALAALAKADPNCLSQIQDSANVIHQFSRDVKSVNLEGLKNDFSSLENAVKGLNDSCSTIIHPASLEESDSLIKDCQALLIDLALNLGGFESKQINFNTDILKTLKYLSAKSSAFSSLCGGKPSSVPEKVEVKEQPQPLEKPLPYQGNVDYSEKQEEKVKEEASNEVDPYGLTEDQNKVLNEILSHTPFGYKNITGEVNVTVSAPPRLSNEVLSHMITDKTETVEDPYELTEDEDKVLNEILSNPPFGYKNITDEVNVTVTAPPRLSDEILSHMITDKTENVEDAKDIESLKNTLDRFVNRKNEVPATESIKAEPKKEDIMTKIAREIQEAMASQPDAPVEQEKQKEQQETVEVEKKPEVSVNNTQDDVDFEDEMAKIAKQIQAAIDKQAQEEAQQQQPTPTVETVQPEPIAQTPEAPVKQDDGHVLSGMITSIFNSVQKENAKAAQEVHEVVPQEEVHEEKAQEAPREPEIVEPVKPQEPYPKPECLSQIYQSFSTLYGFGANAMAQDTKQVLADYVSLKDVTQAINTFCDPKVVFNAPKPAVGDCDTDFNSIVSIIDTYKDNNPADYTNAIKTVQNLWDVEASFVANCVQSKQKTIQEEPKKTVQEQPRETVATIDAVETKTCDSLYIEAVKVVYQISEDAATEDLNQLVEDYAALKEAIFGVNLYCEKDLRVNLFAKRSVKSGECKQHFVELRERIGDSSVHNMEGLTTLVQDVWGMASSFLKDC